ncbi:MAG: arylesterase [Lachnospiraceae bacterium]|nr:arylesterase [Lachnospiraceae bacterium]
MKQILCFGDSNTWGLVPKEHRRYPWGQRWTSILQEKLGDTYRVVEEGLCGRTTIFEDELRAGRKGSDILPILLESHIPDTVVLMLGTNDCKTIYNASAQLIGKGIELLLDQIEYSAKKCGKEIEVLLIAPIRLGDNVGEEGFDPEFDRKGVKTSIGLTKVYGEIAERRKVKFLSAAEIAQPSRIDREHLDQEGHRKLAKAIYQVLVS